MNRNIYDSSVDTFSPQGRLHQVEYATSAVKLGSAIVAAKSNTHVVLAGVKRSTGGLSESQEKVFHVTNKIAISLSGLGCDGRVVLKSMRDNALNYKYTYGDEPFIPRMVTEVADDFQLKTQDASGRPYGVGVVVAGIDYAGPHIHTIQPNAIYNEVYAAAMGASSQSANTYLENNFETFPTASREELINHVIKAINTTFSNESMESSFISVVVIGPNEDFHYLSNEEISQFLN